jgi:pimeloyl-ACP methyl ester carboxylesterase
VPWSSTNVIHGFFATRLILPSKALSTELTRATVASRPICSDSETPKPHPTPTGPYPAQLAMVVDFLDALGLEGIDVAGHDHGGAIAQMLATDHPERINRLVLCNAEAYDNWPSGDERPFVVATQLPVLGAGFRLSLSSPMIFKLILTAANAVKDRAALTDDLVTGYVRAKLSDPHKRAKTARFLAGQLDPNNNPCTLDAIDGLRRFDHPTLLLWGTEDTQVAAPVKMMRAHRFGRRLGQPLAAHVQPQRPHVRRRRIRAMADDARAAPTVGRDLVCGREGSGLSARDPHDGG